MKKIVAAILAVVMLLTVLPVFSASAAPVPSFEAGTVTGGKGKSVEVDIVVKNNPGIASIGLDIGFDEDLLELDLVEPVDFKGNFQSSPLDKNPITVNWISTGNNANNGVVARLHFTLRGDLGVGQRANITLSYDENDVFDENFDNVYFATQNGSVTVICLHEDTTFFPEDPSTCTHQGTGAYTLCNDCEEITEGSDALLPLLPHVCNKQAATEDYLKSAATCTAAAEYYYSCECGHKGTDTFKVGAALGHTFDSDADTECNVCFATAYPGGNTLVMEGDTWYHVIDREKVNDTTLVKYNNEWYYVKNGVVNNENTLFNYNNIWYHVNGGKLVRDTTLVKYNDQYWYVKNGELNRENTLVEYGGAWYHVNDGKWVKDNALVEYNGTTYHVINGVVDFDAHAFDKQLATAEYLKSAATCTAAAEYFYSCECGQKGTDTFKVGSALGHTFDSDADTECNVCFATAYPGGNTLVKEDNTWYHIIDRNKVSDTTLVQYAGSWYYVKNGEVDFSATTLVSYGGKMWYIKGGIMSRDNTLVQVGGVWYHVNNGTRTQENTLVEYNGALYHVKNGIVDFNGHSYDKQVINAKYLKSASTCTSATIYYKSCSCGAKGTATFTAGNALGHKYDNACDATCNTCNAVRTTAGHKYDSDSDTVCNHCSAIAYPGGNTLINEGGTWYHIIGRKKVSDTTLVQYGGVWYYVKNGKVDFAATTLVSYGGKMWYVKAGKMARDNTVVRYNNVWYHVNGGNTTTSTTLVQYGGVWYYVKSGKIDFAATTLVSYGGKTWYVKAGKMARDNTLVKYNNLWYHVNGGTTTSQTTLVKYGGVWYGVRSGKVDFNYTGYIKYNGKNYRVVKGKLA